MRSFVTDNGFLAELCARRVKLTSMMQENSVLIMRAAKPMLRNGDVVYPYRPNSDFYYASGFPFPDSVFMLKKNGESLLFCDLVDPLKSRWEGELWGPKEAKAFLGFTETFASSEAGEMVASMLASATVVYGAFYQDTGFDALWQSLMTTTRAKHRKKISSPWQLIPSSTLLDRARLIKSPWEVAQMRKAVTITAAAHDAVLAQCRVGATEYQLEAAFLNVTRMSGSAECAYPSIVASGKNACVLHYHDNMATLQAGEIVLVDAGCEWNYYASDITRNYPVSGKFNARQKEVYNLVLEAQEAALAQIKPGVPYAKLQEEINKIFMTGIASLKLTQTLGQYYMHGSGHWLGMDVHDCGTYEEDGHSIALKPGMVLTVEPGLYINEEGLGIRIEDDILVTESGYENLSKMIPKTVEEIESRYV